MNIPFPGRRTARAAANLAGGVLIGCVGMLVNGHAGAAGDGAAASPPVAAAQGGCEGPCTFQDMLQGLTTKLHAARLESEPAAAPVAPPDQVPDRAEKREPKHHRVAARHRPAVVQEEEERAIPRAKTARTWGSTRLAATVPTPRKPVLTVPRRVRYASLWTATRSTAAAPARVPVAMAAPVAARAPVAVPVPTARPARVTSTASMPKTATPVRSPAPAGTPIKNDPVATAATPAKSPFGSLDIR